MKRRFFAVFNLTDEVAADPTKSDAEWAIRDVDGIRNVVVYESVAECVADYEEVHDDRMLIGAATPHVGGGPLEDAIDQCVSSVVFRINRLAPSTLSDSPYQHQELLEEVIRKLGAKV